VPTLFDSLEKSTKSYRQLTQANIAAAGIAITLDQWQVLKTLQDNPDITHQEIADRVFKDLASVTRIIDRLVRKGAVRRTPHSEDRRRWALTLTRTGCQSIRAVEPIVRASRRQALRGIAPAAISRAHAMLARVVLNCETG
jgi:MarR family transcriptional regulator, transcriptional regulator for hemolysin